MQPGTVTHVHEGAQAPCKGALCKPQAAPPRTHDAERRSGVDVSEVTAGLAPCMFMRPFITNLAREQGGVRGRCCRGGACVQGERGRHVEGSMGECVVQGGRRGPGVVCRVVGSIWKGVGRAGVGRAGVEGAGLGSRSMHGKCRQPHAGAACMTYGMLLPPGAVLYSTLQPSSGVPLGWGWGSGGEDGGGKGQG
jgi:hypothetical protein